jgi:hypothetical protein
MGRHFLYGALMKTQPKPVITEEQQALLEGVQVRLIVPEERERFDQRIVQEHYLHNAQLVGEQLRYVAEFQGRWVALMSWSAAAFKLKLREEWMGWTERQKRRRLPLVVNNSRFLILKEFHVPNLASKVMKLVLQRLSTDWQAAYQHPALVAESFVDRERYLGTAYKVSGWTLLGQTQGYGRSRADFYQAHDRPKELWVRELVPGARTLLRGRNLPSALAACEATRPPECPQEPEQLRAMMLFFEGLTEWRKRKPDFRLSSLVTVCVCAMLCKVCLGQRDLAAFAANLTPQQRQALRFPRDWSSRVHRWIPPSESTFFRLLSHVNNQQLQRALLQWQDHLLGQRDGQDDQVSLDGKELLNSQGLEVVSAYSVKEGRWLGSVAVAPGSNEIPAAQQLLGQVELEGSLVTADALHTQAQTARMIVQDKGADFLLSAKGNQPGVAQNVEHLYQSARGAFSPSGQNDAGPAL